jgi:hypothetical protein
LRSPSVTRRAFRPAGGRGRYRTPPGRHRARPRARVPLAARPRRAGEYAPGRGRRPSARRTRRARADRSAREERAASFMRDPSSGGDGDYRPRLGVAVADGLGLCRVGGADSGYRSGRVRAVHVADARQGDPEQPPGTREIPTRRGLRRHSRARRHERRAGARSLFGGGDSRDRHSLGPALPAPSAPSVTDFGAPVVRSAPSGNEEGRVPSVSLVESLPG